MSPEAQRIAIAEACGYMQPHFTPNGCCVAAAYQKGDGSFWGSRGVPDYLYDLNAIYDAVKTIPQNLMPRYFACLCNVVSGTLSLYGYSKATEATASQRCEAFLKTINKWTNDN